MTTDEILNNLAADQHGLVLRRQAAAEGADRSALSRRFASPAWIRLAPGLYRSAAAPDTVAQRALAAVLDVEPAVLTDRSAAAWWGLPGYEVEPVHVARIRSRRHGRERSRLGIVHDLTRLPDEFVTTVRSVPVLTPAALAMEMAGWLPRNRLERLVDGAITRRLLTPAALAHAVGRLGRQGKNGTAVMREIVRDRPEGYIAPESGLEARFERIARSAGLRLERQVEVGGDDWVGRVDFLERSLGLVLEVDSDLHHSSLSDRRADAQRQAGLEAAGFHVERIREFDVWHGADDLRYRLSVLRAKLVAKRAA